MEHILALRSIRAFTEQEVEREKLTLLLQAVDGLRPPPPTASPGSSWW